jgi:hypothetical protein
MEAVMGPYASVADRTKNVLSAIWSSRAMPHLFMFVGAIIIALEFIYALGTYMNDWPRSFRFILLQFFYEFPTDAYLPSVEESIRHWLWIVLSIKLFWIVFFFAIFEVIAFCQRFTFVRAYYQRANIALFALVPAVMFFLLFAYPHVVGFVRYHIFTWNPAEVVVVSAGSTFNSPKANNFTISTGRKPVEINLYPHKFSSDDRLIIVSEETMKEILRTLYDKGFFAMESQRTMEVLGHGRLGSVCVLKGQYRCRVDDEQIEWGDVFSTLPVEIIRVVKRLNPNWENKWRGTYIGYDGTREEGEYIDITDSSDWAVGLRHGRWLFYNKDGVLEQEGDYNKGEKNGHWILYYPDGTKKFEGEYLNGRKDNRWQLWESLGEPQWQ